MFFISEITLCFNDIFEWKGFSEKGLDFIFFDIGSKLWKNRFIPRGTSYQCQIR